MDVITRPRAAGKTYEMINLFTSDEKYILIVRDHKRKDHIVKKHHLLPQTADRVITHDGKIRERLSGLLWGRELLVDDADELLYEIFGQLPRVITVTGRNFDHGRENKTAGDCGDGTVRGGD